MTTVAATEGVIAINKPPHISSAQCLRDLQNQFNPSAFFAPWLQKQRDDQSRNDHLNKHVKRRKWTKKVSQQVKLGHGGTLDPMATGVLIVGIGAGTKDLNKFLDCTKQYEAVVLFGAASDSYDNVGKLVGRKPSAHVTRSAFEQVLANFKGKIKQKPPIFSALRMDGKRLYEYAREGKEPPRKIEARPVEVEELELVEWFNEGEHEYKLPKEEADEAEKEGALKIIEKEAERDSGEGPEPTIQSATGGTQEGTKRKADELEENTEQERNETSMKRSKKDEKPITVGRQSTTSEPRSLPRETLVPPAAKIRMTVSSGFYVRSLCHDLGLALDTFALMASLVRTRQGDFELKQNVIEWDEFTKGEDVWAPQVQNNLNEWNERR